MSSDMRETNISLLPEEYKRVVFEQLKFVAKAIVKTLGECCEVVIHDLADLEHSIIWIEGNVTNRRIGGPLTDLGLAKVQAGNTEDLFNYATHTEDSKTLKSSSTFLKDEDGETFGALCINLDITPFLAFNHTLHRFCNRDEAPDIAETFSDDVYEILETMLAESAYEVGRPISLMTKDDKVALVGMLDEKGAFQIKKAVALIAKRLDVSRYTVYNYLNEARVA